MKRNEFLKVLMLSLLAMVTGCNVPVVGDLVESKRDRERRREAEADSIRNAPVKTELLYVIEGDFRGPSTTFGATTFQPAIRFGIANQQMDGGQITSVVSADVPNTTLDTLAGPGFWRLIGENRIEISGTTPYYAGKATIDGAAIRLANGVLLTGGSIYPVRRPVGGMLP